MDPSRRLADRCQGGHGGRYGYCDQCASIETHRTPARDAEYSIMDVTRAVRDLPVWRDVVEKSGGKRHIYETDTWERSK
jgi:hypothetical protein